MKIVFFGTSNYCLPVLESLKKNFDLQLVVTRPDKPEGRKQILTPSATKTWVLKNNVPVATPSTLKKDTPDRNTSQEELTNLKPDLAIVADYGLIIPEAIYSLPKLGTINIHFSKLPDLRGPSPVQFTLLRGDPTAWITFIKIVQEVDAGPILSQHEFPILPGNTTATLYTRLFQEAAQLLPETLKSYVLNPKSLSLQDNSAATFCRHLTKDDGFLSWEVLQKAMNGEEIKFEDLPTIQQEALLSNNLKFKIVNLKLLHDFYRGVTPWPGLWTIDQNGKRVKIIEAKLEGKKLIISKIQYEGKTPQAFLSFPRK